MPGTSLERRPYCPPVPVKRRPESEAVIPRAVRSARRNPHLSVPLAVPPACWTCALVMHSVPHGAGLTVVGTGIAAAAVAYFAPHKWDRREKRKEQKGPQLDEVLYARASAAAAFGWLSLAAWAGPLGDGTRGIAFGSSLLALSAAWGYPWWKHKRPRGRRQRRRELSVWGGFWQRHAHDFGVPGSRVLEASPQGVTVTLLIQLVGGKQTVAGLRGRIPHIESALDGQADAGMVSVDGVKGNAARALVRIRAANPLEERVEWDQSLAPRSVHEPWAGTMTEAGEWRMLPQLTSSAAGGMTGFGKSTWQLARIAALSGCPDAIVVVVDLKGGRSLRPVLEAAAAAYVITTVAEARTWLRLCAAEILARSENHYEGHADLHATPEVPAVITVIDETSGLTGSKGDRECRELLTFIAAKGRGLAFFADVASQYWALDASVGTEETRINLPLRVSFRTETKAQGGYVLDDPHADSSALENPGDLLLKLGPKADTLRLRGVDMSHDLFREVAGRNAGRVTRPPWVLYCGDQAAIPADEARGIPAVTCQQWWDERFGRLRPAFREISPQYREWADAQPEPEAAPEPVVTPPVTFPARPSSAVDDDSPSGIAARITAGAAPPDRPAGPLPRLTREQVRKMREDQTEAFCAALQAAADGATAQDLADASGRSLSWTYDTLKRLTAAGATVKAGDRWRPQPGTGIRAALGVIDAADERLRGATRCT